MNRVKEHLDLIKEELKRLGVWETTPPSIELLNSKQPFSVDTLEATQWLQWVFVPKMEKLMEEDFKLSNSFCISPYFEQVYCEMSDYKNLIAILAKLDDIVTSIIK